VLVASPTLAYRRRAKKGSAGLKDTFQGTDFVRVAVEVVFGEGKQYLLQGNRILEPMIAIETAGAKPAPARLGEHLE
jgi:hypothetical protein